MTIHRRGFLMGAAATAVGLTASMPTRRALGAPPQPAAVLRLASQIGLIPGKEPAEKPVKRVLQLRVRLPGRQRGRVPQVDGVFARDVGARVQVRLNMAVLSYRENQVARFDRQKQELDGMSN